MSDASAPDILVGIMERKRAEIAERQTARPLADVDAAAAAAPPPRGFAAALAAAHAAGRMGLIAEVKKASPSKGLIRADFDPAAHARAYEQAGAACLSVLTDSPGFQGDDAHLQAARAACGLPILRKDFMWDPYQIAEARALGADAILLILAVLDDSRAAALMREAERWGLDVLVEVHDAAEMARAAALGAELIGVNNRNLRSFYTDLATFETLAPQAPPSALLIAESGIATPADVQRMAAAGAAGVLVGESLMRAADPGQAAAALMGVL